MTRNESQLEQEGSFEAALRAKARQFEIGPLLRVLESRGYTRDKILFEGNPDPVSSSRVVESIRFTSIHEKRVTITLNFGLLGQGGLLPDYFFAIAERADQAEAFYDFIRFFDHQMIDGFFEAIDPTANPRYWKDWTATKGFYLRMLGLNSIATLQWYFQLNFPELGVQISRSHYATQSTHYASRVGYSKLDGSAILGKSYDALSDGFRVDIFADEQVNARGESWPHVLRERLDREVLPLLHENNVRVQVVLRVAERSKRARLGRKGYLGFERLGEPKKDSHSIVLYDGNEKPSANQTERMAQSA